jgi:phage tail-like protein
MARQRSQDWIQNYRFHVLEATGTFLDATAGFKAVTTPDLTLDVATYRDGLTLYTFKQPGLPTIGNCTLSQGVTQKVSGFYTWIKAAAEGGEYRADLSIDVYDNSPEPQKHVVKTITMFDAFPIRNKILADLESSSVDISVKELELAVEQIKEAA